VFISPWAGKVATLAVMVVLVATLKKWHKHMPWYAMAILAFTVDTILHRIYPMLGISQKAYVAVYPWLTLILSFLLWLVVFYLICTVRYYVIPLYVFSVAIKYFFEGVWFSPYVLPALIYMLVVSLLFAMLVWAVSS